MTPRIPLGWRERLDRLRQEQDPRRYREVEQPTLQLPLPPLQGPSPEVSEDPDQEQGHGVIVIDI